MPGGIYKHKPLTIEHKRNISLACKGKFEGSKNPAWKGGKYKSGGYILIHKPEHPFCNCDGYVLEHRLIIEQQIGRFLKSEEEIHHINGVKNDNRKENLMLFENYGFHMAFHRKKVAT